MLKKGTAILLVCLLLLSSLPAFALEDGLLRGYDAHKGYQYVTFGRYPTEKDGTHAPILWRVLKVEGGTAYLLSEYILFASPVHADYMKYSGWLKSDLYAYLNSEFLNEAFSVQEQAALIRCWEDDGLVTLISGDELRSDELGFVNNNARLCESTAWARRDRPDNKRAKLMIYSKGHKYSPWWSRTESTDNVLQQRRVMDEGKTGRLSVGNPDMGVRPAIYLNLSMVERTGGSGSMDSPFVLAVSGDAAPLPTATAEPEDVVEEPGDVTEEPEKEPDLPEEYEEPEAPEQPEEVPVIEEPNNENGEGTILENQRTTADLINQLLSGKVSVPAPVSDKTPAASGDEAPAPIPDEASVPVPDEASVPLPETEPVAEPVPENNSGLLVEIIETDEGEAVSAAGSDFAFTAAADPASIDPHFPALTLEGFLPEGEPEFVWQDEESGLWLYASQTLRIQIDRRTGKNSKNQALRWFEARIYTKDASERFSLFPYDAEKYTNAYTLETADKIALKNHLVFGINSDYFIYRVGRDKEEKKKNPNNLIPIGIEIRDKQLFYASPKKASSEVYPPLDYLVFYEDGSVQAFANTIDGDAKSRAAEGEALAQQWLADGATDCLSFGPVLVENGVISPRASMYGNTPNPRTAFGYVEPGYYICVMVESRTADSKGESCIWLGEKMAELGCVSAMNLDGGATSTMLFMGRQINKSGNYGDITNRKQNELLGIGISDAVGN